MLDKHIAGILTVIGIVTQLPVFQFLAPTCPKSATFSAGDEAL